MIGLPTNEVVVEWLAAEQELEEAQRAERILYRIEGRLYREALAELGPIEGVVVSL